MFKLQYINISDIISLGDNTERVFFNWLNNNKIFWTQLGSDLSIIQIYKVDYIQIKNYWKEIKSV